jgi:CHAT domain-containing protein
MSGPTPGDPAPLDAAAWAEALVDEPDVDPADLLARRGARAAPDDLAVAWALKQRCYAAWNTQPAAAVVAADRLEAIRQRRSAAPDPVAALAAWTRGIAELAGGRLSDGERALAEAGRLFAALGDPQHRAETQVPMVMALAMQGRHDEALAVARECRAAFEATGDERAAAKVELNTASLLTRQDRYAEAAPLYRSAAVRFARVRDLEHSVMADIGLANALTWSLDFDEAQRINERARQRAQAHGLAILQAQAEQAIGHIELLRGRYDATLRELTNSLARLEQAGAGPQRLLDAEMSLASAYAAVNLLPESLALHDRVIERAGEVEAPTELADALLGRATVHERLGDDAAALADLSRARTAYLELEAEASAAWADLRAAALHLRQGDAATARKGAADAAGRLQALGIVPWALEARTLEAEAHAATGVGADGAAAEQAFRDVLADADAVAAVQLACHRGLGALAWRRGDAATARRHLDTACRIVDEARAALPGDALRVGAGAEADAALDLLIDIDLATGAAPARIVERLDAGRARALGLALRDLAASGGEAGAAADDPRDAAAGARTRLQWLRERRQQAMVDGDAPAVADLASTIARREFDLLESHRRRVARSARPGASGDASTPSGDPDALRTEALQAALAPDQALVLYHRHGDRLVAGVVTRDDVAVRTTAVPQLDASLDAVRFQIDAWRFGAQRLSTHAAQLRDRAQARLHAAWQQVWAPLEPLLAGRERVIVVPHGALHYLPFAALHDGRGWLVERHELCVAPSAGLWLASAGLPARRPRRALAVAVGGDTLPQVRAEARAVAAALGAGAVLLEDTAATATAVREAARGVDVLHLACHGEFRADNPAFSSVELADGLLTLHDLQQWRLSVPLVALSACDTAMSRTAPGDERVGLVRGFLAAGTTSVLASGWPVDDASTAALMGVVYTALAGGASPAAALRTAQAEVARAGGHPYHWAAFTVYGRG